MTSPNMVTILAAILDFIKKKNQVKKVRINIYYINTNEIPGELSTECDILTCENNMLSSHVKISPLLWLHNKSAFHTKKLLK